MTTNDDEILGIATGRYPAKRKRSEGLGKLHKLLEKGLPDYCGDDGLEAKRLAKDLGISYQAIYKWFDRERIAPARIRKIVELSAASKAKPKGFKPLVVDDFWAFMG